MRQISPAASPERRRVGFGDRWRGFMLLEFIVVLTLLAHANAMEVPLVLVGAGQTARLQAAVLTSTLRDVKRQLVVRTDIEACGRRAAVANERHWLEGGSLNEPGTLSCPPKSNIAQ